MVENFNIYVVLDRSGSMEGYNGQLRDATIAGFNEFLGTQQRDNSGTARLTLVQFDDIIETVIADRDIREVPMLNRDTFVPRGSTSLYDAIGTTLDIAENKALSGGGGKNLVVIITDGGENSSRRFSRQDIYTRITSRRENGWDFVFIGANQDAWQTGSGLGVAKGFTRNFTADVAGSRAMYAGLSSSVSSYRSSGLAGQTVTDFFANEDKEAKS